MALVGLPEHENASDFASRLVAELAPAAVGMRVSADLMGRAVRRRRGRLQAWSQVAEPLEADVWPARGKPMLAWLRRRKTPPTTHELVAWGKRQRTPCDPMEVAAWLEHQGRIAFVRDAWVVVGVGVVPVFPAADANQASSRHAAE